MNLRDQLLRDEIYKLRQEWHSVRKKRLQRKGELLQLGHERKTLKKDKLYREFLKRQKKLSILLKHRKKKVDKTAAHHLKSVSNKGL